jgi:hypothetical protein
MCRRTRLPGVGTHLLLQHPDGAGEPLAAAREVLPEQRSANDAQRELHHHAPELDLVAWPHAVEPVLGLLHDQPRVALDALVAEAGLDAAALPSPIFTVAGEQAIAQQLEVGRALVKSTRLADQDFVDEVRVAGRVHVHVGGLRVVEVAVGGEALAYGAQHVTPQIVEVA